MPHSPPAAMTMCRPSYWMWSIYPYGEIEPFTRPKFGRPTPLTKTRPDLPVWLDVVLTKSVSINAADRYGDVIEFVYELENAATSAKPATPLKQSLYERNPLLLWKMVSAVLLALLVIALLKRHG